MVASLSQPQQALVTRLLDALTPIDGVAAIALGGSFARGTATPTSDIDLGLYYHDDHPFSIHRVGEVAARFNDTPDPVVADYGGWGRWVNGGAWLTISGQRVDFLWRSIERLQATIDECQRGVYHNDYLQQPATGFYSYMYLAELNIAQPLHDPQGIVAALKQQTMPYLPALKTAILTHFAFHASFALDHADKAAARADVFMHVGCLHRAISAMIHMLYALNERYFINDKGALDETRGFALAPHNFEGRVRVLLLNPGDQPSLFVHKVQFARALLAEVNALVSAPKN